MLNLQKVLQELKVQKMNLIIDRKIIAGLNTGRPKSATSNASFLSGASGMSAFTSGSNFTSR